MKKIVRSVYSLVPFKPVLFRFIRAIFHPSREIYKHLHFNGVIKVQVPGESKHFRMKHFGYELENELFWEGLNGIHERVSMSIWMKLCKNADCILDIGANTGIYALTANVLRPNARIYAFEPVRRIHARLLENVSMNSSSVTCIQKAVSDYTGEGFYYDTMTPHLYSATVNKNIHDASVPVEKQVLETIRLDDFIEAENIKRIDLMKIDVETHEPEVLLGFQKYIGQHLPDIIIEILNDEIAEKVHLLLPQGDYVYYDINENSGPVKISRIRKSSERNILICKRETAIRMGLEEK